MLIREFKETTRKGESATGDFILDLEGQIKNLDNEIESQKQFIRLSEVVKLYQGEDRVISSTEIASSLKSRPPEARLKTGHILLDGILKGFALKQLVVIAAPTKNGKTSFCIDMTTRMKETSPLWLPFEEPAEELVQKFLDRAEQPPVFFTPEKMTGNTLAWVEKKIIESKVKYGSQIVFIDHLHFIVPFSMERQDLRIGETMRELKRLAKQWNVVIFLIAHLKKTRVDVQPDLEDLRDSSFIAQEADTVILLWRKTKRENGEVVVLDEVNVSVQANRREGKTGNVKMTFNNGRFYETKPDKELDETFDTTRSPDAKW